MQHITAETPLVINARFLTQQVTGTQRYARELTRQLIALLGPERVRLMAPRRAPEEFAGVVVFRCGGSLRGHVWEQLILPYAVKKLAAELLWCPVNCGPLWVSCQVVTIHDAEVFAVPEGLNSRFVRWYRFLLPRLASRARRVITVSDFSKSELMKYLGLLPDKIRVIHNGISKDFRVLVPVEAAKIKEKYGLSEKYILALASRTPHKNLGGLLRAWQLLYGKPELDNVGLVIAGGITRSLQGDSSVAELARLPRVHDLGYVPEEDLPALYGGAAVFVYPSIYEGFGLPPLEAMACGTPVVVSNMASLPEVVGDAGVYINPYDVDDIALGIYQVLTDGCLRQRLREKGLARAKLFTWEKTARKTLAVFEEVVCEQRRKKA